MILKVRFQSFCINWSSIYFLLSLVVVVDFSLFPGFVKWQLLPNENVTITNGTMQMTWLGFNYMHSLSFCSTFDTVTLWLRHYDCWLRFSPWWSKVLWGNMLSVLNAVRSKTTWLWMLIRITVIFCHHGLFTSSQ